MNLLEELRPLLRHKQLLHEDPVIFQYIIHDTIQLLGAVHEALMTKMSVEVDAMPLTYEYARTYSQSTLESKWSVEPDEELYEFIVDVLLEYTETVPCVIRVYSRKIIEMYIEMLCAGRHLGKMKELVERLRWTKEQYIRCLQLTYVAVDMKLAEYERTFLFSVVSEDTRRKLTAVKPVPVKEQDIVVLESLLAADPERLSQDQVEYCIAHSKHDHPPKVRIRAICVLTRVYAHAKAIPNMLEICLAWINSSNFQVKKAGYQFLSALEPNALNQVLKQHSSIDLYLIQLLKEREVDLYTVLKLLLNKTGLFLRVQISGLVEQLKEKSFSDHLQAAENRLTFAYYGRPELETVAGWFGVTVSELIKRNSDYLLPRFIENKNEAAIEELLKIDSSVLIHHAHAVFVYIFNMKEMEEYFTFFHKTLDKIGINMHVLMKSCGQKIIYQYILHSQVKNIDVLKKILEFDGDLSEFIGGYTLGFLHYVTSFLTNSKISVGKKETCVKGLKLVLELGTVDEYLVQFIQLLTISIAIPELKSMSLECWSLLLEKADFELVKPFVHNIVILLLNYEGSQSLVDFLTSKAVHTTFFYIQETEKRPIGYYLSLIEDVKNDCTVDNTPLISLTLDKIYELLTVNFDLTYSENSTVILAQVSTTMLSLLDRGEIVGKVVKILSITNIVQKVTDKPKQDILELPTNLKQFVQNLVQTKLFPLFTRISKHAIYDRVAFILQEFLKIVPLQNYKSNKILYASLKPLGKSRYNIKFLPPKPITSQTVFEYGSFDEWLNGLTILLIDSLKDEKLAEVFRPLKALLRGVYAEKDISLLLFNQLVFYTLLQADSQVTQFMFQEFKRALENDDADIISAVFGLVDLGIKLHFSPETLTKAAVVCKQYTRALRYFEEYLKQQSPSDTDVRQLQDIYLKLVDYEPDGMIGISNYYKLNKNKPSVNLLPELEATGKWHELLNNYQFLLSKEPSKYEHRRGLLNSLKQLGHWDSLIIHLDKFNDDKLAHFGIEASYKLGRWDLVDDYARTSGDLGFDESIGILLSSALKRDSEKFEELKTRLLVSRAEMLNDTFVGRLNDVLLQLQQVREIEEAFTMINGRITQEQLISIWESRMKMIKPSLKQKSGLVDLRRVLLEATGADKRVVGNMWLLSAKLARKGKNIEVAQAALLNAESYAPPGYSLEKAKIMYLNGDVKRAIDELSVICENITSTVSDTLSASNKNADYYNAKSSLLLARWFDAFGLKRPADIQADYKKVNSHFAKWEKGWFYSGCFFNKLMESDALPRLQRISDRIKLSKDKQEIKSLEKEKFDAYLNYSENLSNIIRDYARSLQFGKRYIYQTLPRLLTLWLDYSVPIPEDATVESGVGLIRAKTKAKIQNFCLALSKRIPSDCFLLVLAQLISRICHPCEKTFEVLEKMILKVILEFPEQALWYIMSGVKSTDAERSRRCGEIVAMAKKEKPELKNLVKQYIQFTDQLLALCNYPVPEKSTKSLSVTSDFGIIKRMMPLRVIVPTQTALTSKSADLPRISSFQDSVVLMNSLVRPKRIGVRGSDGGVYNFLCKPKDDLRKDSRVLEFYGLVNKLLANDTEARKRQLNIRTYAVTPLNEECGLIEWVPFTTTFRSLISKYYKHIGFVLSSQKVEKWRQAIAAKKATEFFVGELLRPHQPPQFHKYLLERFSEPSAWFQARLRWTRSVAVMSIVGFIVGLGDRHTENILIDQMTGDVVHVDFNCLFERGLAFEFPERVPFRLTHNMIDGFGVTGTEGVYTQCAELTLGILRNNQNTVISVLESFIHDPLVEWTQGQQKKGSAKRDDYAMFVGQFVLNSIVEKLQGGMGWTHLYNTVCETYGKNNTSAKAIIAAVLGTEAAVSRVNGGISLGQNTSGFNGGFTNSSWSRGGMGVAGQVQLLIEQATSSELMSNMWIGWSPFL